MLPQKEKNTSRQGERLQAQLVLAPSMMLRAPWVVPNVINPGLLLNMQPCCRMMPLSMPQMLAAGQPVFGDHHWNNQLYDVENFDNSGSLAIAHQQNVSESSNIRSTLSDATESCSSPLLEDSDSDDALLKFQKSAQMHGIAISNSRAETKSSKTCSALAGNSLNIASPQIVNFKAPESCTHDVGIVSKRKASEKATKGEDFSGQPGIRCPEEMKSGLDDQEQAVVACENAEFTREAQFDFSYDNFCIEDAAADFRQNDEDCEYCSFDSVETEPLQVADSWTQTDVNDKNTEIPIKCHMSVSTDDLIIMVDASTSMEPANISDDYGTVTIASQSFGKQCLSSNTSHSYYSLDQSFASIVENDEKSLLEVEAVCLSNDIGCRNPTTEKAEECVNGGNEDGLRSDSEPTLTTRTKSPLSVDTSASGLSRNLSDVPCRVDSATDMEDVTELKCLSAEPAVGFSCPDIGTQPHGNDGNVQNGSTDLITMDIVKMHLLAYYPALANNPMVLESLAIEQMTLFQQQRLEIMIAERMKQRLQMLPLEKPHDALFQSQPHHLALQMPFQQQRLPFAQQPMMLAPDRLLPRQEGLLFPQNLSQLSTAETSRNQSPSVPSKSQSSAGSFTMIGKDTKTGESAAHRASDIQQRFNDLNCSSDVKNYFPKNIPVKESDQCRNLSQLSLTDQLAMLHEYERPSYFGVDHGDDGINLSNVHESPQSKQSKKSVGKLGRYQNSVSSSSEFGDMILSEELVAAHNSEEAMHLPKLKDTIRYHSEMDVMPSDRLAKLSANTYPNQRPAAIPFDKGGFDMMFGESTSAIKYHDIHKGHEDKHDYAQFCPTGKEYPVNLMTSASSKAVTKGMSLNKQEEGASCSSSAVDERSQKLHSQPTAKLTADCDSSKKFAVYRNAGIDRLLKPKEQSVNCSRVSDFSSRASSSSFQRHDSAMADYESMMASGEVQRYDTRNRPESDDFCRGTWQHHSASEKNFVGGDSSESKRCFATEKGSYVESWMSASHRYQHGAAKCQEDYLDEASNAPVSGWVKDSSHYSSKKTDNASKRVRPKGAFSYKI